MIIGTTRRPCLFQSACLATKLIIQLQALEKQATVYEIPVFFFRALPMGH